MQKSLIQADPRVIAIRRYFVTVAELIGVPESVASIYGELFAATEPLSFTDLQERLGYSKGAVSMGLRTLKELGAVKAVEGGAIPGRREYFVAETELRQLVGLFLADKLEPALRRAESALEETEGSLPAGDENLDARIQKLRSWNRKAGMVLPVLRKVMS